MTMRIFNHTIWIARPRALVFDLFTDFGEAPKWRSYVKTMAAAEPGPLGAGSRINVEMDVMGKRHALVLTVLDCTRPSLWRHKTDETDFNGFIEYRFDEENDGTRVTMSGEAKPISVYGWLALPQLWLARGQAYREQLPQLKRLSEQR